MRYERYGSRFWAVYDEDGDLVCVTVYKKGAQAVIARMERMAALRGAAIRT